jgi:uncharacterized membrane protein
VTNTRLIVTMAVMPMVIALTAGVGGVWLTGDVRVFGLVGLAAAIVGAGLVGYFNWRARFRRQMIDEADHERRAA